MSCDECGQSSNVNDCLDSDMTDDFDFELGQGRDICSNCGNHYTKTDHQRAVDEIKEIEDLTRLKNSLENQQNKDITFSYDMAVLNGSFDVLILKSIIKVMENKHKII